MFLRIVFTNALIVSGVERYCCRVRLPLPLLIKQQEVTINRTRTERLMEEKVMVSQIRIIAALKNNSKLKRVYFSLSK